MRQKTSVEPGVSIVHSTSSLAVLVFVDHELPKVGNLLNEISFGNGKKWSRSVNGYFAFCISKDRVKECSRHLSSVIFSVIGNYMILL